MENAVKWRKIDIGKVYDGEVEAAAPSIDELANQIKNTFTDKYLGGKTEFDHVKDSGQRRDFSTGSRRDVRTGKGRYDLLNPIVTLRLARHYENGAVKYGDRNWELGQPMMSYMDSCKRHLDKFQEGSRDEDHLSAAIWNVACMIYTEEMINRGILPKELNDMPNYLSKEGFERTVGRMTREFNERQKNKQTELDLLG